MAQYYPNIFEILMNRQAKETAPTVSFPWEPFLPLGVCSRRYTVFDFHRPSARSFLLSTQEGTGRTDGNLHQAVWQPAGFCLSLFRPHRHSGAPAAVDAAGEYRSFFPGCPSCQCDHEGWSASAHRGLQPLGGSFCPQAADSPEWAEKGVRKEDYVRSYLQRRE